MAFPACAKVHVLSSLLTPEGLELESQYYNGPLLLPVAEEGWGASLELPLPIFPLLTYQTEMNECHAVRQTQCGHGQLKEMGPGWVNHL